MAPVTLVRIPYDGRPHTTTIERTRYGSRNFPRKQCLGNERLIVYFPNVHFVNEKQENVCWKYRSLIFLATENVNDPDYCMYTCRGEEASTYKSPLRNLLFRAPRRLARHVL